MDSCLEYDIHHTSVDNTGILNKMANNRGKGGIFGDHSLIRQYRVNKLQFV